MSHWTVAGIKLHNVNREVLKRALELLAKELGSRVVENFKVTGYMHEEDVDFAIPYNLPYGNGYGVKIVDGGIKVVVDDHGAPLKANDFVSRLGQYYVAVAFAKVASEMGARVENFQKLGSTIMMDIVR